MIVKYPEALAWKFPGKDGIRTKGGQLAEFPNDLPYPTQEDIDAWEAEWKDATYHLRNRKYPSIDEQLDMLYWDQVNGTTNWKDAIAAEKKRVPKKV